MNERIDKISDIVVDEFHDALKNGEFIPDEFFERFAELIVRECVKQALKEKVSKEEIDEEVFTQDQCYLRGNNDGITDAVIRIEQYFGVEE